MSLLPLVSIVALTLLVPAFAAALLLARGRHASSSHGVDRRARVAVATVAVAVAAVPAGVLLDAGAVSIVVAAAVLAVPVLGWALLAPWWPVRAVVAWALLVTASVAILATGTTLAFESRLPWTALPVAALGSVLLVAALGRVNVPFRRMLGIRAGIRRAVRTPALLRPALLRPAMALAVFFATLAITGFTGDGAFPGATRPEAGETGAPGGSGTVDGSDALPVSAETTGAPSRFGTATTGVGTESAPDGRDVAGTGDARTAGTSEAGGSAADPSRPASRQVTASTDQAAPSTADDGSAGSGGSSPAAPTGEVTGTVEKVTETVTDVVKETTQPTTETVKETTQQVEDTVKDTTQQVEDTVQDTTQQVEDTVQKVEDTVGQVTDPVTSALP